MNRQTIGRCSNCGGAVTLPLYYHSVVGEKIREDLRREVAPLAEITWRPRFRATNNTCE